MLGPEAVVLDGASQFALNEFRADNGLPTPSEIDEALLAALFPGSSGMAGDAKTTLVRAMGERGREYSSSTPCEE